MSFVFWTDDFGHKEAIYLSLLFIYCYRYEPSQVDSSTFEAIKSAPAASLPYALRWFNHVKSFGDLRKKFPAATADSANGKAAAADDDDVDLFGSDDEEEVKHTCHCFL